MVVEDAILDLMDRWLLRRQMREQNPNLHLAGRLSYDESRDISIQYCGHEFPFFSLSSLSFFFFSVSFAAGGP